MGKERAFVALVLFSLYFLSVVCVSDYITQKASVGSSGSSELQYWSTSQQFNGFETKAFYAWISNPVGHFRVLYPEAKNGNHSCEGYVYPSRVAKDVGCEYATNGGPFIMFQPPGSPTCLGNIISDENVVQLQNTTYANFGLTNSGDFAIGLMDNADIVSLGFEQLLSGFGWLVREGLNQVTTAGGEIAPRTAIGTNEAGELLLFQADGVEDRYKGLTLQQLSTWLMELGVYSAINLDGGGSSVTVVNGTIVNHPTCSDTIAWCERMVTTVTCIMP